jgi:hypothetical protein
MNTAPPEPENTVELVAVYRLPVGLTFEASCLGVSAAVRIADLDGELFLPTYAVHPGGDPYIVPPLADVLPPLARRHLLDRHDPNDPLSWGLVTSWNSQTQEVRHAKIGALLFRFKQVEADGIKYSNYLHGRGHPIGGAIERLFTHFDTWFERVRLWVRVLTDQDVDEDVEASLVSMRAENLEVLTIDGGTVSLPGRANSLSINMLEVEALGEQHWRRVLELASSGRLPPVEYLLVSSGRIQLRAHQYRRAVIDAATAVDVALTDLLQTNLAGLPPGLQSTLNQDKQTLGWLVDILNSARGLPSPIAATAAQFPSDLKTGLVRVRNDVMHRNRTPTYVEAQRAVAIADEVVRLISPLL